MIARIRVRTITGKIIDSHATAFVQTADLIARALAFQYPGCEIETTFQDA